MGVAFTSRGKTYGGYEILPMHHGDKKICDTCTLAPACFAHRPGGKCNLNDTPTGIWWPEKLTTGSIEDLDLSLQSILALQAERVLKLIEAGPADPNDPKSKAKHEERVDRNLQRLFSNAMQYRSAKAPRLPAGRGASKVISENGESLPDTPSPQMIAEALHELEQLGFNRNTLTRRDALEHLASRGQLALSAGDDEEPI